MRGKVHVDRSLLIQGTARHDRKILHIIVEKRPFELLVHDLRKALSSKIREQTNREDGRKEK